MLKDESKLQFISTILSIKGISTKLVKLLFKMINKAYIVSLEEGSVLRARLDINFKRELMEQTNLTIKRIEQAITAFVKKDLLYRVEPTIYDFNPQIFGRMFWGNINKLVLEVDFGKDDVKGNIEYKDTKFNRIAIKSPNSDEELFRQLLKYIPDENDSAKLALMQTIKNIKHTYYIVSEEDEKEFLKQYREGTKIIEKYRIMEISKADGVDLYNSSNECLEDDDIDTCVYYIYCIDETGLCFRGYQIKGEDDIEFIVDKEFSNTEEMESDKEIPSLSETWEIREVLK